MIYIIATHLMVTRTWLYKGQNMVQSKRNLETRKGRSSRNRRREVESKSKSNGRHMAALGWTTNEGKHYPRDRVSLQLCKASCLMSSLGSFTEKEPMPSYSCLLPLSLPTLFCNEKYQFLEAYPTQESLYFWLLRWDCVAQKEGGERESP